MMVSVLYKVAEGGHFDFHYYLSTHIPLVAKLWGPSGMKPPVVLRGTGTASGDPASYACVALLDFPSMDAFQSAAKAHGGEIIGDIKNFTDANPTIQFNDVIT